MIGDHGGRDRQRFLNAPAGRMLADDLVDLHLGLDIGKVGKIGHHCCAISGEGLLEVVDRIEVEVANSDEWRWSDAQLVLARVLLHAGSAEPAATREIGASLDRAQEIVEQTGAESRRPRLDELRAKLETAESRSG